MTKRSLIHPTLKTVLSSLELEIEAEINRYQHHKNQPLVPHPKEPNQLEGWSNSVMTAAREIPVISVTTVSDSPLLGVFKKPLGLASVVLTAIASGLLGTSLSQPVQLQKTVSGIPLVEGLNLAEAEIELNLQTISTLINTDSQVASQTTNSQPIQDNRIQQPSLLNSLIDSSERLK
ncbi:hypothetical protein [Gloeocapsa sp. PCC 73106]|uniref:hypothetical protein n=1 Tax=Gloeocapsa sp. PCC 73106 TaxID=102232 RepID=UPI0002AC6AF7|nr:hypothetical protein [Gloeocapsa sp. PCC 73106]ELR97167.1 hypothetical protein GLO73106DRAFT_00009720 [Gloeocapsa sp. PCC 73106]